MAPTPKQQVASAEDYLAFAVGLWRAAEGAKPDRGSAFYFLAAFSVEVGLKAFLVHTNVSERELITLGHDLKALLRAANKCGLRLNDPGIIDVVEALSEPHRKHHFRYPISPGPELLHRPDYTLKMTGELMTKVSQAIGYKG